MLTLHNFNYTVHRLVHRANLVQHINFTACFLIYFQNLLDFQQAAQCGCQRCQTSAAFQMLQIAWQQYGIGCMHNALQHFLDLLNAFSSLMQLLRQLDHVFLHYRCYMAVNIIKRDALLLCNHFHGIDRTA